MSKPYRKRDGSYDRRGKLKNRISIDDRALVVNLQKHIGGWEGDTIIVKITGKRADVFADNAIEVLRTLSDRFKTLTRDNGLEFSENERISKELGVKIYFAHPYSSWERGLNENTNGLIRQYFPKGMNLNTVTEGQIQFLMNRLNNRPRKN